MQYSVQSLYDQSAPEHHKITETEEKLRLDLCEKLYSRLAPWEVIAIDGKFTVHYGLNIKYTYGEIDHGSVMKTRWPGKISIERWQNNKCTTYVSKFWVSEKINDEIVNTIVSMLSWESDYRKFKRENTSS